MVLKLADGEKRQYIYILSKKQNNHNDTFCKRAKIISIQYIQRNYNLALSLGNKTKKCHIKVKGSKNHFNFSFVLFPKPSDQVRILIYRNWPFMQSLSLVSLFISTIVIVSIQSY